jgi:hypothetical protein
MNRTLLAAALLCLVLSCGTQPAIARHHGGSGKAPTVARGDSASERAAKHRPSRRIHQRPKLAFSAPSPSAGYTMGGFVERARAYIGRTGPSLGLPARLWCSDFMNMITGGGTGSRLARSWLSKPHVSPQVVPIR